MCRFCARIFLVAPAALIGATNAAGQDSAPLLPPAVSGLPPAVLHSEPATPRASAASDVPGPGPEPAAPIGALRPGPSLLPPLPSRPSDEFAPAVDSPPPPAPRPAGGLPPLTGPISTARDTADLPPLGPLPAARSDEDEHRRSGPAAGRDREPVDTPPPPPRRRGLFRQRVEEPEERGERPAARLEFDDPATRTALRKELEKQARDAGGRQLRSVEVRVNDAGIVMRARASNLLTRRGLKRKLEALPGLAGIPATVVID